MKAFSSIIYTLFLALGSTFVAVAWHSTRSTQPPAGLALSTLSSLPMTQSCLIFVFALWQRLWAHFANLILNISFSREWNARAEKTLIVSLISSGFIDRACHAFQLRATRTFEITFITSLVIAAARLIGQSVLVVAPSSEIITGTRQWSSGLPIAYIDPFPNPSDTSTMPNRDGIVNGTDPQNQRLVDYQLDQANVVLELEQIFGMGTWGYSPQPNWLIPLPLHDLGSLGQVTYQTDLASFHYTCSWRMPNEISINELVIDNSTWVWETGVQGAVSNPLNSSAIIPLQNSSDPGGRGILMFLLLGSNSSFPINQTIPGEPWIDFSGISNAFSTSGLLNGSRSTIESAQDRAPLAALLMCDPQLDFTSGTVLLGSTVHLNHPSVQIVSTTSGNHIGSINISSTELLFSTLLPSIMTRRRRNSLSGPGFDLISGAMFIAPPPWTPSGAAAVLNISSINLRMDSFMLSSLKALVGGFNATIGDQQLAATRAFLTTAWYSQPLTSNRPTLMASLRFAIAWTALFGLGAMCLFTVAYLINDSELNNYTNSVQIASNITNVNNKLAERLGMKKLLEKSVPEASYDSAARWPPPQCHPGTREKHFNSIMKWASNSNRYDEEKHLRVITWVKGPAGVGKSAIAQTCANALAKQGCLAGSFFFSRPNGREDPNQLFTTLAHQFAVWFMDSGYGEILDESIRLDSTILEKAIPTQFEQLFVLPFQKLAFEKKNFPRKVMIIDGRLLHSYGSFSLGSNAILKQLLPVPRSKKITNQIELTISPDLNPEIHRLFTDKLADIRARRGIKKLWPTKEDIATLVDISAGLYAHSDALIHFIEDPDSEGPEHQLRIVLGQADEFREASIKHPLAALDLFYDHLVLKRIPESKRRTLRCMLIASRLRAQSDNFSTPDAILIGNVLGKAEDQVHDLCRSLHSVMILDPSLKFKFHHASFMDFLEDRRRSKEECIWSEPETMAMLLGHVRRTLDKTSISRGSNNKPVPMPPLSWTHPHPPSLDKEVYVLLVRALFKALESLPLISTSNNGVSIFSMKDFDFSRAALLDRVSLRFVKPDSLRHNLKEIGVIRSSTGRNLPAKVREILSGQKGPRYYVIGTGKKSVLLMDDTEQNQVWVYPH
ncbi:hypothetical protein NP233_g9269 [Leucocoprinus birnbaumii]|uniref:Nephrocystin 3-like N-terminal domain-containing protein n=1 Tax=Leucocoprinus birnbaumii TaxID=56174 RepID=A0AAD5VKY5_9AGAR|nr:hypothetical protein NP233_g9269 [Leucocoprinus birnbaumii]